MCDTKGRIFIYTFEDYIKLFVKTKPVALKDAKATKAKPKATKK